MSEPSHRVNTARWIERLRAVAASGSADLPTDDAEAWLTDFADEAGHRRAVDEPFLRWRLHRAGVETTDAVADDAVFSRSQPDVRLWANLARKDFGEAMPSAGRAEPALGVDAWHAMRGSIEVWTETDLCALHAVSWWAVLAPTTEQRTAAASRLDAAVAWHLEHTQPDNATHHPWAAHVFAWSAVRGGEGADEAELFAQTLLHNAVVSLGRPDRLSSHVLADASDALSALLAR